MALAGSARITGVVLVDACGIEVPGHPVADFFALTLDQVAELSYHDPGPFRIDPAAMSAGQRAVMAGNREALAVYGGTTMTDPGLRARLGRIAVPALVLWGDSDRIVDPGYGRAYAAAIPGAEFRLLPATGHVPQIETPAQLLGAIRDFAAARAARAVAGRAGADSPAPGSAVTAGRRQRWLDIDGADHLWAPTTWAFSMRRNRRSAPSDAGSCRSTWSPAAAAPSSWPPTASRSRGQACPSRRLRAQGWRAPLWIMLLRSGTPRRRGRRPGAPALRPAPVPSRPRTARPPATGRRGRPGARCGRRARRGGRGRPRATC